MITQEQGDQIIMLLVAIRDLLRAQQPSPLPTVPYEQIAAMMDVPAPASDPLAGMRRGWLNAPNTGGEAFDGPTTRAVLPDEGAVHPAFAYQLPDAIEGGPLMTALPLPPARPAGSLHMIGPLADPIGTPGAVNPDYTEADIDRTIRVGGWTSTVRPPTSYTTPLKRQMMIEYGYPPDTDPATLELDHKVPLCTLGHPTSALNLYPQPREGQWGAKTKDICEVMAQHAVLNGLVSLDTVQKGFMSDWTVLYSSLTHNPKLMASMMMMTLSPPEDEP